MRKTNQFTRAKLLPCVAIFVSACAGDTTTLGSDETLPASAQAELSLDGYVRTPGGLIHRDCVYNVPSGAHIRDQDGETRIETEDGGLMMAVPPCPHAPRTPGPVNPLPGGTLDAGYAAVYWGAAQANNGLDWFNGFWGQWTVPAEPTNADADTLIYMFNGLEPGDYSSILQPVLQYGVSPAGGGAYWSIGAWYVDPNDNAMVSSLSPVAVGDQISGYALATSCTSDGDCDWIVAILGADTSAWQGLSTTADNHVMRTAFAGALEIYGTDSCDQLPASGVTFSRTSFTQPGMLQKTDEAGSWYEYLDTGATQTWTPLVDTTGTPTCNYALTPTDDGVTITWTSS